MSTAIDKPRKIKSEMTHVADLTDEQLLLSYRETGKGELYAHLVRRYEHEIYSYLRRYLGNAEMAEDAFQGAFLQLHLKCDQFEAGRKLRPWLYMIATNQAIDLQRRNKRHRVMSLNRVGSSDTEDSGKLIDLLLSPESNPLDSVEESESQQWVHSALKELPEYLRLVVDLVYFQGLKYREAAEVLSIPVGTIKSRLHSAILKLTESWNCSHTKQERTTNA